jgi:methyl-accepting chemotaxis protein
MTQNSSNTSEKWNIKKKVIMLMALTGLIPFLIFFILSMTTMKREVLKLNENRLMALKEDKKFQIERYFQQIRDQVLTLSESRMIIEAIQEFNRAFFSIKNDLPILKC